MLDSLLELAQEGTDDAWRRLFIKLCQFVVTDIDGRSDQELAIFAEVILKLYGSASTKDKQLLSRNISTSHKTPKALAKHMATDEAEVASPLLSKSPVFSQDDLLHFVDNLGSEQLQIIARRPDLSAKVSDALVKKGDTPVHRVLAGNREAQLSRDTMLLFVKKAAKDMALCEELVERPDLSPTACRELLPLVNEDVKKRLNKIIQNALTKDQLNQIARLKELRNQLGRSLENADMKLLWSDAERMKISVDELTILLLQDGRFNHVIELLAYRGRIAKTALKDAVFNGKKDVVLKTAARNGLKLHTFSLFSKVRCDHLKIPTTQGGDWIGDYTNFLKGTKSAPDTRASEFKARRKERPAAKAPRARAMSVA